MHEFAPTGLCRQPKVAEGYLGVVREKVNNAESVVPEGLYDDTTLSGLLAPLSDYPELEQLRAVA